MALLTSHGAKNKITDERPKTIALIMGAAAVTGGLMLTYNTTYTERFRYIGMTATAADTCQAAMIALYTETVNGVPQCIANVSTVPDDGNAWQVSVSVMRVSITTKFVSTV